MSQSGQVHFKTFAANTAIFLKCVWPFWGIGCVQSWNGLSITQISFHRTMKFDILTNFLTISLWNDFSTLYFRRDTRVCVYLYSMQMKRILTEAFWKILAHASFQMFLFSKQLSKQVYRVEKTVILKISEYTTEGLSWRIFIHCRSLFPTNIYLLKVSNRNTRKRYELCS